MCISVGCRFGGQLLRHFSGGLMTQLTHLAVERDGEKMLKHLRISVVFVLGFVLLLTAAPAKAQLGNAGSIEGVVKDSSGGVVAGAKVEISYPVTGYQRETTTGSDGAF